MKYYTSGAFEDLVHVLPPYIELDSQAGAN